MSTYPCSKCGIHSPYTWSKNEEVVQESQSTSMPHVYIKSFFKRCSHWGYFRWDLKSYKEFCVLSGWEFKLAPYTVKSVEELHRRKVA